MSAPDARTRRPARDDASIANNLNGTSVRQDADVTTQIRARRAASWRSFPLPTGLRDPLDGWFTDVAMNDDEAWLRAVEHIHGAGLRPIVPPGVRARLVGRFPRQRGAA